MPLHTDHRPLLLDDIVGNRETVQALKVHLGKDRPNRSLLFVGPSGCGKTTLAYCVAKELGALEDQHGWNFKMLNASDFRGIDTVREVREASGRRPIGVARARIWLWDEAAKISPDGQEAMLKLLEDPPRDCWFLLATTNPEKLKVTLKRRCTEFQVAPVKDAELTAHLQSVLRKERKRVPPEVLTQIIGEALGSPGIALNILDKIIDLPREDMQKAVTKWAERTSNVITLCRAMLEAKRKRSGKGAWRGLCSTLQELEDEDPETIRRQVLEYFRKVFLGGETMAYDILLQFSIPYYDTGKSGLAMSVFQAFCLD